MEVKEASVTYAAQLDSVRAPRGYKKTAIGLVPQDWAINQLGALITSAEYGSSDKSAAFGDVPVLRMGNLQSGKIVWGDLVYTSNEHEISKYSLIAGDVLFNRTNTIDLVGKTSLYEGDYPAIFAGYLIRIKANSKLADSRFLNYVLNAEFSRKHSTKVLSVAVGQANINAQKLRTYPIPTPEFIEQEAIAEALSDADALIESLEQLLAKKRQIKQGTMQQLLTGKKRLPGFSGEWELRKLQEVVQTPVTDGPHLTPRFLDEGIPFLSVNNLINNQISFDDLRFISETDHAVFSRKCRPQEGDVLLGKAASVGKVAIVETDIEFNIWSPIALIRPKSIHVARFIYYQFQATNLIRQITLLTNSSSQGNIGMGEIEKLTFCLPVKAEQTAIATILSDMDTELAALDVRLTKARQLKQGMMQVLLTGAIRLPLAESA